MILESRLTVAGLLSGLGYQTTAGDLDETIRWALIELSLRRQRFRALEGVQDLMEYTESFDGYQQEYRLEGSVVIR